MTEALKQWCDPQLISRVETEERSYSVHEMNSTSYFQLTPQSQRQAMPRHSWKVGADFSDLGAAWRDLKRDFRERILRGQIFLEGVQTKPERRTRPEPIPSAWAGDFQFDFAAQAISVEGLRFGAVTCSLDPPLEMASDEPIAGTQAAAQPIDAALMPEDVPGLSDEAILALLEEHARRVIAGPDAPLIAPGRISLLPIIRRKMEYRAAHGQLESKLAEEADVLASWIASKVEHHQVPTAPTIAKVLGKAYAVLRTRSKADI